MIEIHNLTKSFGRKVVFQNLKLESQGQRNGSRYGCQWQVDSIKHSGIN